MKLLDTSRNDLFSFVGVDQFVAIDDDLFGFRMTNGFKCVTSLDTVIEILDDFLAVLNTANHKAFIRAALVFANDDILGHVDKSTSQVTGVSGTKRRIGKTFTRTVRGQEVLEYRQSFTEVRFDREFDDTARRVRHQTPHATELGDLRFVTPRFGIHHEHDGVKAIHRLHEHIGNIVFGLGPDVDNAVITFFVRNRRGDTGSLPL